MNSNLKHLHSLAFSKPFMLILMGLSLGFSLNMLLSFLFSDQCFHSQNKVIGSRSNHLERNYELRYKSKSEIENEAILNNNAKGHRIVRPRYLSTELGLKEKLFMAVLTSTDTVETFGSALNQTISLSSSKSKLAFFMNGALKLAPLNGMHLVMFSEGTKHLIPFYVFKHLIDNYLHVYNWFYIFPDTTFVNVEQLEEFVDHVSVGENLLIGSNCANGRKMCDLDSGILMSQRVLMHLAESLQWCMKHSSQEKSHSENVEGCLRHSMTPSNVTCSEHIGTLKYQTLRMTDFVGDVQSLQPSYNSIISFSKIASETLMYILYRRLAENSKELMELKLLELYNSTHQLLPFIPDGNSSSTWPLGSETQSRARTRFDIIRWQYFNESFLLHDRFDENIRALKGTDKVDVSETLKDALMLLNKGAKHPLSLERLVNGYRRFDSSRGMEYTLDVLLSRRGTPSNTNKPLLKRVHLVRPLGRAEIVPMPYVTENTPVNLVLTVLRVDRDEVSSFVDSFAKTCIESGDNSNLVVVFVYESTDRGQSDIYAAAKAAVSFYEEKYRNKGRVTWTSVSNDEAEKLPLDVMNAVYQKLPRKSLVFTCTFGMELKIDFLNHVRMNTIAGWQVYFPIGYWSYKPQLVFDKPPFPTSILINQKSGHYSADQYVHASFYLSDFIYSRNQMFSIGAEVGFINLYEMFLRYNALNVFRAVDPKLRLHFKNIECPGLQSSCLRAKHRSLASRSQLAMLLFEHQQELDELQLDVMHQQRGENLLHVEADVLK